MLAESRIQLIKVFLKYISLLYERWRLQNLKQNVLGNYLRNTVTKIKLCQLQLMCSSFQQPCGSTINVNWSCQEIGFLYIP